MAVGKREWPSEFEDGRMKVRAPRKSEAGHNLTRAAALRTDQPIVVTSNMVNNQVTHQRKSHLVSFPWREDVASAVEPTSLVFHQHGVSRRH
jgi:hypothetical protein